MMTKSGPLPEPGDILKSMGWVAPEDYEGVTYTIEIDPVRDLVRVNGREKAEAMLCCDPGELLMLLLAGEAPSPYVAFALTLIHLELQQERIDMLTRRAELLRAQLDARLGDPPIPQEIAPTGTKLRRIGWTTERIEAARRRLPPVTDRT